MIPETSLCRWKAKRAWLGEIDAPGVDRYTATMFSGILGHFERSRWFAYVLKDGHTDRRTNRDARTYLKRERTKKRKIE